jgi:hypothetical protein
MFMMLSRVVIEEVKTIDDGWTRGECMKFRFRFEAARKAGY